MATSAQATSSQSSSNTTKTPEFILDYDQWTIKRYADVKADVEKQGYGIISYAWGKWHNKAKCVKPGAAGYPKFDIGNDKSNKPLSWIFPVLNQLDSSGNFTNDEQFEIGDIQKALGFLKMRYIWWDWTCIPQGWDWNWITSSDPGPDFHVHPDLKDIKDDAMEKMRYFYPASKRGCLWWHQTTWGMPNMPVEDFLACLQNIVLAGYQNLTTANVEEYVGKLEKAREWEQSLQSLWSFQEGVLFADSARPQDSSPLKVDDPLLAPGVLLDRQGLPLKSKSSSGQVPTFQFGQADLVDIYAATTIIASEIAGALVGNVVASSPFQQWLKDDNNHAHARLLLSKLIASGMVGYTYNSPLPLLEARFGRKFEAWNTEVDISVNAIMGALSVDMGDYKGRAKKAKDAAEDSLKKANKSPAEVRNGGTAAELESLKRDFVTALFNTYQWRMLLLAREKPATTQSIGFWKSLIGKVRPRFAALEEYIGDATLVQQFGPIVPTDIKFGDKPVLKPLPEGIIPNLPLLSIPDLDLGALVVHGNDVDMSHPYAAYLFTTQSASSTGWKSCTFYSYVAPPIPTVGGAAGGPVTGSSAAASSAAPATAATTPPLGGTVAAVPVQFAQRDSTFGQTFLLLPIETVTDQKPLPASTYIEYERAAVGLPTTKLDLKTPTIRCAIVINFKETDRKGDFLGIGDFTGLGAGTFPLKKDISLY